LFLEPIIEGVRHRMVPHVRRIYAAPVEIHQELLC
jgi:hypothetical protein